MGDIRHKAKAILYHTSHPDRLKLFILYELCIIFHRRLLLNLATTKVYFLIKIHKKPWIMYDFDLLI